MVLLFTRKKLGKERKRSKSNLFLKAMSMNDSPERNALFIEIFEVILDDLPVIWVHEPLAIDAVRSNVKNYYTCTGGRINLHKVDID